MSLPSVPSRTTLSCHELSMTCQLVNVRRAKSLRLLEMSRRYALPQRLCNTSHLPSCLLIFFERHLNTCFALIRDVCASAGEDVGTFQKCFWTFRNTVFLALLHLPIIRFSITCPTVISCTYLYPNTLTRSYLSLTEQKQDPNFSSLTRKCEHV